MLPTSTDSNSLLGTISMNIYSNIPSSEFKPTWLYIKQHNTTGLRYFGKTTKDPQTYLGSGRYWLRHLKEHSEDITTVWCEEFTDMDQLVEFATFFSEFYNIVDAVDSRGKKVWANMIPENGLDGAIPGITPWNKGIPRTDEEKQRMSQARKGFAAWNKGVPCKEETKSKLKDRKRTEETKSKIKSARSKQVIMHSEETKKKISDSHKGKIVTEEAKIAMRKPKTKIVCPHCNMLGGSNNMYRWHFNNCKLKGDNNE